MTAFERCPIKAPFEIRTGPGYTEDGGGLLRAGQDWQCGRPIGHVRGPHQAAENPAVEWPVQASDLLDVHRAARAQVAQEIAEALDKLAATTRAHHVGAEDYATAYAWAAMEARRHAAGVAPDEAEERTAVAESEQVWTGDDDIRLPVTRKYPMYRLQRDADAGTVSPTDTAMVAKATGGNDGTLAAFDAGREAAAQAIEQASVTMCMDGVGRHLIEVAVRLARGKEPTGG